MTGRGSVLAVLATMVPLAARADSTPMTYLRAHGPRAYPVSWLTWGLLIISIAVILVVAVLLLGGLLRRRTPLPTDDPKRLAVERVDGGLRWIYIGVGVSSVVLLGSVIWTLVVLAAVGAPTQNPAFKVEITGHQWWWEARYMSDDPARIFTTANEIHVPVGKPVQFKLVGADVIHSFWVPALTGKTDVIPGQSNTMWLQAGKPGVYRGQCTEYCGKQHAQMALFVVADPPDAFQAWWDHQLAGAPQPASKEISKGQAMFVARCGACHAVRGTGAGGILGPDLTHLMSRSTIAAGTLPNNPGYLSGWIADPQVIKQGARMPTLDLSGPELAGIRRYLETLR